ncbi:MAG TPA: CvpA family protein [Rhodopila sp.]|uniref:CvpA family protein n=1 Tax=Rhodopila sp. TaxID=2480087 RepID=UPI002CD08995|nr:CvpA family protein [Rhodopila sp.]HVY14698.1 CvpA family protein [Rhodopila sp.]
MTWVDIAVFGFVALSGLLAFGRGLVREVLGIAAWLGAGVVAFAEMPAVRGWVQSWVPSPEWIEPASFIILFLIALVVFSIVAKILAGFVRNSVLGGLDRTLGLVFGLVRGACIVIIAYIIAQMVIPIDRWPEPVLNARVLTPTYEAAAWVRDQLPPDYRPHRLDPPPQGRETTAEALFHAAPEGRATGKPEARD